MSGPIRGLHDVEGKLFAVSGRTLYQISNAGVAIPRGTIPGVGRVSMAHNQKAGGNELIVVNGSGGYVWNTADETFTVVTDEGYPGGSAVDFVDGYLMQVEPFGRFLFHSNLADALDYNTLDRFEAETAPDRTVGMIVNHQEVWAFGERTIDVFGNTGTATGTFKNKGVSISRGCAAKWSPAIIDNGTAWLGDDLKVYHATGYGPVRISTRAIECALAECSQADIRNAFSFVWEDLSHAVYYLTVPNGPTFGFDFSTRLWHRRASWHPERDISGRWRLNDLVKSNGRWIGGDYQTGKLYVLDHDYPMEGCEPLVRERVAPLHNNGNRFTVDEIEAKFDTGGKVVECVQFPFQPVGPQIEGEAPDGLTGDPYSFTYTTTPGTGAIVRTVLRDTTLPSGWSWDEATATISHDDTPVPTGAISLKMRVYDVNGLYADHEDVFLIAQESLLLFTGDALTLGAPVMATARALTPLSVEGIEQSTGADISDGIGGFYEGVWCVVAGDDCRYHEGNDFDNWQSSVIPFVAGGSATCIAGGPSGWVSGATGSTAPLMAKAAAVPSSWEVYEPDVINPFSEIITYAPTMKQAQAACYLDRYNLSWNDGGGTLCANDDLGESITIIWPVIDNSVLRPFHSMARHAGKLWAASSAGMDGRQQLVSSDDEGATWDVVLDFAQSETPLYHPWHVAAGVNILGEPTLVVLCWGAEYFWTSADSFATPHPTGIATSTNGPRTGRGAQIVLSAGVFYAISGENSEPGEDASKGNKCVSTLDGITVSAPVSLPLKGVRGIATDYVEPSDD